MQGSPFRVLIALITALALTFGSIAGTSAGVEPVVNLEFCEAQLIDGAFVPAVEGAFLDAGFEGDIDEIIEECDDLGFEGVVTVVESKIDFIQVVFPVGGGGDGGVTIGGNGNGNNQNNDQTQEQTQEQGQDATQGNSNGASQGSSNAGSAGGSVDNGCDASQGEDDAGDDAVECASGDASTGDSSIGDTNQANSGTQSGSNDTGQSGTQTGGNQANSPSNTTDQTVDADVSDIGGDDNDTDNSDSINGNTGTIDQSDDEGVIEGDDNEIGGADALSALLTQLIALLVALFTPDPTPTPEPLDPSITLTFTGPSATVPGGADRAGALAPGFELASTAGTGGSSHVMMLGRAGSCTVTADLRDFEPNTDYTLNVFRDFGQGSTNTTPVLVATDGDCNVDDEFLADGVFSGQGFTVSEPVTGATTGPLSAPNFCG